jgi:hypothetical protein
MKRWRLAGQNTWSHGVALQAEQVLLMPHQHLGIHRAVRLVTTGATLESHRSVLECEGTTLVRVTLHASGFISDAHSHLPWVQATVRLVTVHTTDGAFVESMPERLGKSCLSLFMTADAELIGFSGQQMNGFLRLMNAVTINAGQLVLAV